jgi:D-alanine--(R)-lactate ligase
METTTVAVVFGGTSEEHDISVRSAVEVAASLDLDRFEPVFVGIARTGEWFVCDGPGEGWEDGDVRRATISPDRGHHGLLVLGNDGWQVVRLDVVFPVLHGRLGEDGAMQGLLELSGIPYVGCDIQSSAICMDKSLTYVVARSAGVATPEFRILLAGDPPPDDVSFPAFVKPARSGSSFGVTRVEREEDLDQAIATARQFDVKVLVEQAVEGSEVGCAVLGRGHDLTTGEVDRIELRHGIFRIHQEEEPEHGSENAVITVPADLPTDERDRICATARTIYSALGCSGLARVDLFLQPDGRLVLNEVNTLPGFTSYSRYPRMMAAAGIDRGELVTRCITLAMGQ